jgi:cytochrome b pre-mRNA-processing protein 3
MLKKSNLNKSKENLLYNNMLLLSRNKLFYTKLNLADTFQNRINLIFVHISFLFIKIKQSKNNHFYKAFYQNLFDLIFKKIEMNMREIGHGDVTVNKNMKFLVKNFYNILLNCEKYNTKSKVLKSSFLLKYLEVVDSAKNLDNYDLIDYFDKYSSFCFDLSSDSVLKGEFNFKY